MMLLHPMHGSARQASQARTQSFCPRSDRNHVCSLSSFKGLVRGGICTALTCSLRHLCFGTKHPMCLLAFTGPRCDDIVH